jgi:hypothetical protein
VRRCRCSTGCRQRRASRAVCECGRRHVRIGICRRSLAVLFCRPVSKRYPPWVCKVNKYRKRWCREGERRAGGPKCVRYVLQSLGGYFKIFANPALLAFSTTFCWRWRFFRLRLLMCASSSLCSTHARALHPRRHQLAGVRGPPHTFVLLPQAQHRVP